MKKELAKGKKSDKILLGQPLEDMLYIGNPDNFKSASQTYQKISKFKSSPTIVNEMNINGNSGIQKNKVVITAVEDITPSTY